MTELKELAIQGTHALVMDLVLRYVSPPARALDLGSGQGPLAERLQLMGFDTLAVDNDKELFAADVPFVDLDLNDSHFSEKLSTDFDVITAVEIIEHLESPIGFLKQIARLLKEEGIAIVTTPNVENVPARLKFLISGKLRCMDELARWHLSPIFYDLLVRQYLPQAGLRLIERTTIPKGSYELTRIRWMLPMFKALSFVLRGPALEGDSHIFVLKHAPVKAEV